MFYILFNFCFTIDTLSIWFWPMQFINLANFLKCHRIESATFRHHLIALCIPVSVASLNPPWWRYIYEAGAGNPSKANFDMMHILVTKEFHINALFDTIVQWINFVLMRLYLFWRATYNIALFHVVFALCTFFLVVQIMLCWKRDLNSKPARKVTLLNQNTRHSHCHLVVVERFIPEHVPCTETTRLDFWSLKSIIELCTDMASSQNLRNMAGLAGTNSQKSNNPKLPW